MPIFVTGGTGFVGLNLVRMLVARGERVRLLVREHSCRMGLDSELIEFVPSQGGLLLIDDPGGKRDNSPQTLLTYVAAYGPRSDQTIGKEVPSSGGISMKLPPK